MLSTFFRFLFPIAVVIGVVLWVAREYVAISPTKVVAPRALTAAASFISNGEYTVEGTIQRAGGYQGKGVPYLFFTDEKNRTVAKQLIIANERGCSVLAGDLPCAGVRDYGAYPDLNDSARVRVTGSIKDDRFFVDTLTIL